MLDAHVGYLYAKKRTENGMTSTRDAGWRRAGRVLLALASRRDR
jgi:hypothetical protein